jgi:hypothetical protein
VKIHTYFEILFIKKLSEILLERVIKEPKRNNTGRKIGRKKGKRERER